MARPGKIELTPGCTLIFHPGTYSGLRIIGPRAEAPRKRSRKAPGKPAAARKRPKADKGRP